MQKIDIQDLLDKYKSGKISAEELAVLESWYLQWQPGKLEVTFQELKAVKDEVWQTVLQNPVKQQRIYPWPKIAAAAVIFLLFSFSAYYLSYKTGQSAVNQLAVHNTSTGFKPGSKKAMLILSNGSRIILKDARNGRLANQGTVTVTKLADGELAYAKKAGEPVNPFAKLAYNTINTPRGGQYNLTLSDGTKVWLNAASSITYPVLFSGTERRVRVIGEAYFEVAHDQHMPFRVTTGNQEITVLGTHFNVNGYAEDAVINTTLLTGAIKIKNLTSGRSRLIKPGQQASIFKNRMNIQTVNTERAISWKNGYFLFDNQNIKSMMTILSRWYDVDIEYRNINQKERYGGTFSRSSNLAETLHNLEQVGKIHFIMQPHKIIVTN